MKRLLAIILASVMLISLAACGGGKSDESMEEILDKKAIIMGYDKTYLPMGFEDESGIYTGFDLDLAKMICKRIVTPSGVSATLNIMPLTGSEGVSALMTGAVDFLGNSITAKGDGNLSYSDTLFSSRYVLAVADAEKFGSRDALKGANIAVVSASPAAEALAGDSSFSSTVNIVEVADANLALETLKNATASAVVMDELAVKYLIKNGETLFVIDGDFGSEDYRLVFNKESKALSAEINRIIRELKEDGSLEELSIKWFGENLTVIK